MRLIDADEVIKVIDRHTREDGTLDDDISCIIEEVRTAYDVDKVERELKNEIALVVREYPLHGKYIKKSRAIDIVRSGGIAPEKTQSKDGKYMHDRESFFKE